MLVVCLVVAFAMAYSYTHLVHVLSSPHISRTRKEAGDSNDLFCTCKMERIPVRPTNNSLSACRNDPSITDSNERTDIVELLEAIAYLICQDDPVTPESYHRILSSRYSLNFPKRRGILKRPLSFAGASRRRSCDWRTRTATASSPSRR